MEIDVLPVFTSGWVLAAASLKALSASGVVGS